ncbi:hypothetical protein MANES_08G147700v8 [Manihot esculenta]|uniref:Uncharacterized protein n=1 Tax=Manihot esculenta TaxID=3983 RepID=A0A2C9VGD3_MANES|nr:hypothetical protein MANES_08G147700v8 [Manihot esculenta]
MYIEKSRVSQLSGEMLLTIEICMWVFEFQPNKLPSIREGEKDPWKTQFAQQPPWLHYNVEVSPYFGTSAFFNSKFF